MFVGLRDGQNIDQDYDPRVLASDLLRMIVDKQPFFILVAFDARTVSDPAEVESELRALCDAIVSAEGRLEP